MFLPDTMLLSLSYTETAVSFLCILGFAFGFSRWDISLIWMANDMSPHMTVLLFLRHCGGTGRGAASFFVSEPQISWSCSQWWQNSGFCSETSQQSLAFRAANTAEAQKQKKILKRWKRRQVSWSEACWSGGRKLSCSSAELKPAAWQRNPWVSVGLKITCFVLAVQHVTQWH